MSVCVQNISAILKYCNSHCKANFSLEVLIGNKILIVTLIQINLLNSYQNLNCLNNPQIQRDLELFGLALL